MDNKQQPPPLVDFTDAGLNSDIVQLPHIGGQKLGEKIEKIVMILFAKEQDNLPPLSIKIEVLIITVVSCISGLITQGISYLSSQFLDLFCSNGGIDYLGQCLGSALISYLITFLLVGIVTGIALKLLRIRHAYLLALFSTLSLIPTYYLCQGLTYYPLAMITTSLIFYYLIFYQLYNALLNILIHKFPFALMLSAIITFSSILFLPSLGLFLDDQGFFHKGDIKLSTLDFSLYIPARTSGRFVYKGYNFNYFSDPPFIQYHFAPTLTTYIYKTPHYFNPPTNCGLPYPDRVVDQAGTIPFPCPLASITPKGRLIYAYSASYQNSIYNPAVVPGTYYTKIENTVISFDDVSLAKATLQEIVDIVDSLHLGTVNELKKMSQEAQ